MISRLLLSSTSSSSCSSNQLFFLTSRESQLQLFLLLTQLTQITDYSWAIFNVFHSLFPPHAVSEVRVKLFCWLHKSFKCSTTTFRKKKFAKREFHFHNFTRIRFDSWGECARKNTFSMVEVERKNAKIFWNMIRGNNNWKQQRAIEAANCKLKTNGAMIDRCRLPTKGWRGSIGYENSRTINMRITFRLFMLQLWARQNGSRSVQHFKVRDFMIRSMC